MGGWNGSLGKGPQEKRGNDGLVEYQEIVYPRELAGSVESPIPCGGLPKETGNRWEMGRIGKGKERACHRRGTGTQTTRERQINGTM
eukprot:14764744-Heterocapsa_arctica.AAC.1